MFFSRMKAPALHRVTVSRFGGLDLTVQEIDGETVVEQKNFRATYTAAKLSFWQDATEVAYVSNNRLYISNITVLEGLTLGRWEISTDNGLAFKWIGG